VVSENERAVETTVGGADRIVEAFVAGGVGMAVQLPDSVLNATVRRIESDGRIPTVICSREDEGVGIATGASLAGTLPVVLMEGSGIGYCGLILARARLMRAGMLIVGSHTPQLGEAHDFHAASRVVGAAVLDGLGIPYAIPRSPEELVWLIAQSLITVRGQREIAAVLVPPALGPKS
jgi:sulfopyruvate decarboxylase TPP-binding subunit